VQSKRESGRSPIDTTRAAPTEPQDHDTCERAPASTPREANTRLAGPEQS
jgi:hypothetical protein